MADDGDRPLSLLVLAEHGVDVPVWRRPDGDGAPVEAARLVDLGASPALVQRLCAWNQTFGALALSGFEWPDDESERAWRGAGLDLSYALQQDLPDVEVRYAHDGDDRPVRERRGR